MRYFGVKNLENAWTTIFIIDEGSQNVYSMVEGVADHHWPKLLFSLKFKEIWKKITQRTGYFTKLVKKMTQRMGRLN